MLLRQMEYFQAVIENGNFYDAAEQCHVSQSAVSQQIKKLEDELGVQLLERHNRTFSLTDAGEHFYRKKSGRYWRYQANDCRNQTYRCQ